MTLKSSFRYYRVLSLATFIGLSLAAAQVLWAPDIRIPRGRSIGPHEFADYSRKTIGLDRLPRIRNIVVYPPRTSGDGRQAQYITGELCTKLPRSVYMYGPFTCYAPLPFLAPAGIAKPAAASYTVRDFLAGEPGGQHPVAYKYAWWQSPPIIFALWIGGCVVLIAGILPALLSFVRSLRPEAHPPSPQPALAETPLMELNVEGEALPEPEQPAAMVAEQRLVVAITPAAPPLPVQPIDDTEGAKIYDGEYYPVAHPSPKETHK